MYKVITNLSLDAIMNLFKAYDRGNNFSYNALEAIIDFETEDDTPLDLDVIRICCEYTESSFEEIVDAYGLGENVYLDDFGDIDNSLIIEFLENNTVVLNVDGDKVVYKNF